MLRDQMLPVYALGGEHGVVLLGISQQLILDDRSRSVSVPRSLGIQSSSQAALCAAVSNAACVGSWCLARRRVAGHLAAV